MCSFSNQPITLVDFIATIKLSNGNKLNYTNKDLSLHQIICLDKCFGCGYWHMKLTKQQTDWKSTKLLRIFFYQRIPTSLQSSKSCDYSIPKAHWTSKSELAKSNKYEAVYSPKPTSTVTIEDDAQGRISRGQ